MDLEFDPAKDDDNRAKHGLSLADAAEFDMAAAVVLADTRQAYGETRYRAFVRMDGKGYCLAFTVRPGAIRAISYRRATTRSSNVTASSPPLHAATQRTRP